MTSLLPKSDLIEHLKQKNDTALHTAIRKNQFNTLPQEAIVSNLETLGEDNKRPLALATELNQLETVRELLILGAKVNAISDYRLTALIIAIQNGWFELMQLLIGHGADSTLEYLGDNMLHIAFNYYKQDRNIQRNYLAVIEMLLQKGLDVNLKNASQEAPFYLAVKLNNLPIVRVLLQAQADVNVKNRWGDTPLHVAARGGAIPPAIKTIERIENNPNFDYRIVREKKQGYDIFRRPFQPSEDETAYYEILKELLNARADKDSQNQWKETPLHLAARYHRPHTLQMLIEKGAKISLKDDENHFASYYCLEHQASLEALKDTWLQRAQKGKAMSQVALEILSHLSLEERKELKNYCRYQERLNSEVKALPVELWSMIVSFVFENRLNKKNSEEHPLGTMNQTFKAPSLEFTPFCTPFSKIENAYYEALEIEHQNNTVHTYKV